MIIDAIGEGKTTDDVQNITEKYNKLVGRNNCNLNEVPIQYPQNNMHANFSLALAH